MIRKGKTVGNSIEKIPSSENVTPVVPTLKKNTSTEWPIMIESVTTFKKLGKGASGVVWLGEWNNKQVAVKEYVGQEGHGEFESELKSLR